MKRFKYLLWLAVFMLSPVLQAQAQESAPPPPSSPKYRLELVYIFEDETTEFIFIIGGVGFKTVESLKNFLSSLPPGSMLEWAPGCRRTGNEPLLSSELEMAEFKAFCLERNINFVLVPSG